MGGPPLARPACGRSSAPWAAKGGLLKQRRRKSEYHNVERPPPLPQPRSGRPFAVAACFAFALVPLPPHEEGPGPLIAAGLLTLIIVMSSLLIPWRRLPSSAVALPPLAYFVVPAQGRRRGRGVRLWLARPAAGLLACVVWNPDAS